VSCKEAAEPIDLPFGLWTLVRRRKHKFNRIRQMASLPTWEGTLSPPGEYDWTVRPSAATMRSYVKLLWPFVIVFTRRPTV